MSLRGAYCSPPLALRQAKRDAVSDDVVMDGLVAHGHATAIAFEERLREESRLDYDDLLRHAARLLTIPDVRRLYQAHFGMVMVDEAQDLTIMQLEIVQAVDGVVDQLAALEGACRAQADEGDGTGLDEVSAACEDLRALVANGMSVEGRRDLPTGDVDRGTCRSGCTPPDWPPRQGSGVRLGGQQPLATIRGWERGTPLHAGRDVAGSSERSPWVLRIVFSTSVTQVDA